MLPKNSKYNIKRTLTTDRLTSQDEIVEDKKPLSQSMIWNLQTNFYANQGPKAWSKGIVPQYITTNPYIANCYAKTVFGYFRDVAARADFDRNTTIYILELAAGIGRFSYTFLKRFLHLLEHSSLKGLKFQYIITDIAEQNVEYWLSHSFLKPYFESGILDCATYDMREEQELVLRNSGEELKKENLRNPLILFANYTFDSVPQDTFYVKNGELYEGLITLTSSRSKSTEHGDNSMLAGLDYYYTDRKIQGADYYADSNLNDILLQYKDCLVDSAFTLPIVAIRCIDRLKSLFGDDIVLISTDKGYRDTQSMLKNYHPFLTKHGCISLTVNFHALELYFKSLSGSAIHSIYEHESVTTSLFLLSQNSHSFIEAKVAYQDIIESIGPDDFYIMKKAVVPFHNSMTTKELLTFLRFTVWDTRTFLEFYNTLLERISTEKDFPKGELITVIHHLWDHYFPIGEEGDMACCLGSLLSYLGEDRDAVRLFMSSIEFYGEDAPIDYEIALCYYNLQDADRAKEFIERSLAYDAEFEESIKLKHLIDEL